MAWVIPSRPGTTGGIEHEIAELDCVQEWLDEYATEAKARAESILRGIRSSPGYTGNSDAFGGASPHARVSIEKGDIDRYIVLEHPAAGAIELGRRGEIRANGQRIASARGKYILSRATGLKRMTRVGRR